MEIANIAEGGIEKEWGPPKRRRAPRRKPAKVAKLSAAKRRKNVFPKDGAKVGIAVTVDTARRLRQYRARLEAKTGDRVTMAEAVDRAVREAL